MLARPKEELSESLRGEKREDLSENSAKIIPARSPALGFNALSSVVGHHVRPQIEHDYSLG